MLMSIDIFFGRAVVELQNTLSRDRVVYCSATFGSEPKNKPKNINFITRLCLYMILNMGESNWIKAKQLTKILCKFIMTSVKNGES